MKNWALKLFTLLLITGIGAVLLHPIRPQAKGDQTLQAKAVKSGPSAKSSISQSVSNTTMSSPEEHFQKEISSSGEVERLSYASRQGWIEDTRHENPEGDFKNVVIHRVFTERGDETPHYTSTHIADEIILSTETPLSDENISDIEEEYNVKLLRKLIVPNTYQFRIAEVSLEKLVQTRASL